jgi:hypothetical protein
VEKQSFLRKHSLSLVSAVILVTWVVCYIFSNPAKHLGSFFGNAIADWSGMLVTVLATKYLYEQGSAESKKPPHKFLRPVWHVVQKHSLTIFLVISGLAWVWLFARMDPQSRWGQVVGNVVSEWTQILGLVVLTKRLIERGSKESSQ